MIKPVRRFLLLTLLASLAIFQVFEPLPVRAAMVTPYPAGPSPQTQRQALEQLKQLLQWLDNATRTASRFNEADVVLWNNYEGVRMGFQALTRTLTPQQLQYGANDLDELDAGWAIIGEAFANFQEDLNAGRSGRVAYQTLAQVLRDSGRVWGQELNRVARRLRIGG
jgi:hypothetical protein